MRKTTINTVKNKNEAITDNTASEDFLFLYKKGLIIALSKQGILNDEHCRLCIERLERQLFKK